MEQKTLTIGLPTGSLMEPTIALFAKAGYAISGSSRSYRPSVDDPELRIRLLRAQEISRYIEHGYLDCGITGYDWVQENESHLEEVVKLPYSKATSNPTRWVLVVPEDSPVKSVRDLEGKRVATEAVGITRRFFERKNVSLPRHERVLPAGLPSGMLQKRILEQANAMAGLGGNEYFGAAPRKS